jgi:hypothetical protein
MTGIILFRAQPFHYGHLAQIKRAFSELRKMDMDLCIIVGSADKFNTKRNPIPIDIRMDLINGVLEEEFSFKQRQHIKVGSLVDLSDEANNTYSWGNYLYNAMCQFSGDTEFIFYYSDKPEIALSWFNNRVRNHICFKFLSRIDNINATYVRECLINNDTEELEKALPPYVFEKRNILRDLIIEV